MGNEDERDLETGQGEPTVGRDKIGVGEIGGGTVAIGDEAQAIGTLVKNIEETNVAGDYVDRQVIHNTINLYGADGLEQLTALLNQQQGIDAQIVKQPGAQKVTPETERQIKEVVAAQQEAAAQGVQTSPQAAYNLGMMAASYGDYFTAINYFQEASRADPGFSDAFEAMAWLMHRMAYQKQLAGDLYGALGLLAKAQAAATHSDPSDPEALILRGNVAVAMAKVSEQMYDQMGRNKYYNEARGYYQQLLRLNENDPIAFHSLANIAYYTGQFDEAIAYYLRTVELAPHNPVAFNDLASSYEAKLRIEPYNQVQWVPRIVSALREAYRLAVNDPNFPVQQTMEIGARMQYWEQFRM